MPSPVPTPPKKKGFNPIPPAIALGLLFVGVPAWLVTRDQPHPSAQPSSAQTSTAPQAASSTTGAATTDTAPATSTQSTNKFSYSTMAPDNTGLSLGNPSGAASDPDNRLVSRPQFDLAYNKSTGGPNRVGWHLDKSDIGRVKRGDFWPDPLLPRDSQIRPSDYRGSGFDRGHQCPSGDRTSTRANNDATFVMSNMLPQAPSLNREVWARLENYCRDQVRNGNEPYIYAGAAGTKGRIGGKVNIPAACWKVILILPQGEHMGAGLQCVA